MPRQRNRYNRRTHAFPADFPQRLERFQEEPGLSWSVSSFIVVFLLFVIGEPLQDVVQEIGQHQGPDKRTSSLIFDARTPVDHTLYPTLTLADLVGQPYPVRVS